MKRLFKPIKGAIILASDSHYSKREGEEIGVVLKCDGGILAFKDVSGNTDWLIWKDNKTIRFGV